MGARARNILGHLTLRELTRGTLRSQTSDNAVENVLFTDEKAARIAIALDKLHDAFDGYRPTANDVGTAGVNDGVEGADVGRQANKLLQKHAQGIEAELRPVNGIGVVALKALSQCRKSGKSACAADDGTGLRNRYYLLHFRRALADVLGSNLNLRLGRRIGTHNALG